MNRQEAGQRGGLATLERYGRAYFARITKGRQRRPRHGKEMLAGRSPRVVALSTTTRAKGGTRDVYGAGREQPSGAERFSPPRGPQSPIPFRPRADRISERPPMESKVIPFGR